MVDRPTLASADQVTRWPEARGPQGGRVNINQQAGRLALIRLKVVGQAELPPVGNWRSGRSLGGGVPSHPAAAVCRATSGAASSHLETLGGAGPR